jgi:sulfite oxidase
MVSKMRMAAFGKRLFTPKGMPGRSRMSSVAASPSLQYGVGGSAAAGGAGFWWWWGGNSTADEQKRIKQASKQYPRMTLEEVRANHGDDIWVTREGGVYNVTPFLEAHPGGTGRIEMTNGRDLSGYWSIYELHNRPHIHALLEEYRIGSLSPEDAKRAEEESKHDLDNYYDNDPVRTRANELRIASHHPWNSEPPTAKLVEDYFTPNDLFFVRNHNAVPEINGDDWRLEIEENKDVGLKGKSFSLKQLKKLPRVEVVSALQCAGNRQEDYVTHDRPLYVAPHWRNGAIGCAKWAGVRVRDVLGASGMDVDGMALNKVHNPKAKIVNFTAVDTDEVGTPYAGVIPVEKAVDPFGDAILAYEMNGETLPRDHGYPVRLLAPGTGGCRNVKWVQSISISEAPSELDSGSKLDRHFAPDISWNAHRIHIASEKVPGWKPDNMCHKDGCEIRLDQGPVIQTLPVQSVLCTPPDHSEVSGANLSTVEVKGVAWSGGGRGICRVEVSADGGKTFEAANLHGPPADPKRPAPENGTGRNWGWWQFSQHVTLPQEIQAKLRRGENANVEIVSKAIDGDFNSQPEHMTHGWNVLGICVNHWSRTNITLNPKLSVDHVPVAPPTPAPGSCVWPESKA